VFHTKNIVKHLAKVPKDIMFYTVMIKMVILYAKESHDLKHSLENSKKRSVLGSFAQRVPGLFKHLIIRKTK